MFYIFYAESDTRELQYRNGNIFMGIETFNNNRAFLHIKGQAKGGFSTRYWMFEAEMKVSVSCVTRLFISRTLTTILSNQNKKW